MFKNIATCQGSLGIKFNMVLEVPTFNLINLEAT